MSHPTETRQTPSPLSILAELAVEGASSFIEAQRIFLDLAQQENELLLNGLKQRIGGSAPAITMTDLTRRSLETFIGMQQEFLMLTNKHAMHWLEAMQAGKRYQADHLLDIAREAVDKFVHAHQKLLDIVTEETANVTSHTPNHMPHMKKTELAELARGAADLFTDAQKKVLDVLAQQMNTNLNAATQAAETVSPDRLAKIIEFPSKAVTTFLEGEKAVLQSLAQPARKPKTIARKHPRKRVVRHMQPA